MIIPYINNLSHSISKFCKQRVGISIAYRSLNKLNKFIKVAKNQLEIEQNRNVVYKIKCANCNAIYVGQTKRKLKTRISEHKLQINRQVNNVSVVTEHRLHIGHDFNQCNSQIVDIEHSYHKQIISEMVHIKLQNHVLNVMSDTEKSKPYFSFIKTYKHVE